MTYLQDSRSIRKPYELLSCKPTRVHLTMKQTDSDQEPSGKEEPTRGSGCRSRRPRRPRSSSDGEPPPPTRGLRRRQDAEAPTTSASSTPSPPPRKPSAPPFAGELEPPPRKMRRIRRTREWGLNAISGRCWGRDENLKS
jgi:hypothetical protein